MTQVLEILITAQSEMFYAQGTAGEAKAESRLLDAAIDAGMPYDEADLHGWVAVKVSEFLMSGPCEDVYDDHFDGWGTDEYGRGEYVS